MGIDTFLINGGKTRLSCWRYRMVTDRCFLRAQHYMSPALRLIEPLCILYCEPRCNICFLQKGDFITLAESRDSDRVELMTSLRVEVLKKTFAIFEKQ